MLTYGESVGTTTDTVARSLAADLRARSDDELVALFQTRPDLVNPIPADMSAMAMRATTRSSVTRALDRLNQFELNVLEALAVLPDPTSAAAVRRLLAVPEQACRTTIETLRSRGLVWGSARSLHLVRTVAEVLGPYPAGLGPGAGQVLPTGHSPQRLADIVADIGSETSGDPVHDAETVAAIFTDHEKVTALLNDVPQSTIELLEKLATSTPEGQVDNARRDVRVSDARTPLEHALTRGLLAPLDDTTVVLPREIGLHLRGGVLRPDISVTPPVSANVPHTAEYTDRAAGGAAFELLRRTETLLEDWADHPPSVLRSGGLGVRDLRRLPGLLDTDKAGAALVVEVAYAAGLLAASADVDAQWLPSLAYDTWSRAEPAERWVTLVQAWLRTSRAAGLVGQPDQRGRALPVLARELDRPLAPDVRQATLGVLADADVGTAPSPEEVLAAVRWHRPRRGGKLRHDLVEWTLAEAAELGVTGAGALASWMRPLLAAEPDGVAAADALRSWLPEPLEHVLIQADLTAVAPGPLRSDLAHELGLMADEEGRGAAGMYRFTPESVQRALDNGRTRAELHEFLETISRTPVPQPLSYLVDDAARRHGLLRVGAASSFVRSDDPSTIAAIVAAPQAAGLRTRRLADTVLVSDLDAGMLVERLRRAGFTPTPEGPDGQISVARVEPRRAPVHAAPEPTSVEPPMPEPAVLEAAVRALRSGERAAEARPADAAPGRLGRGTSGAAVTELRAALHVGGSVWIGYVDNHGATSERVVDPVKLEGGWLSAFDHRAGRVRSFAVHRISGVAPAEAS